MRLLQLKDMFPGFRLSLPPKRWFKDNYNSGFLEDRQLGLQTFLKNLIAHKDISNWYVAGTGLVSTGTRSADPMVAVGHSHGLKLPSPSQLQLGFRHNLQLST